MSWSDRKMRQMIYGKAMLDPAPLDDDPSGVGFVRSVDGSRDEPVSSWYSMVCYAFDRGSVDAMNDVIHFEQLLDELDDLPVKAAVCLAMMGWDHADIGAALRNRLTGEQLVRRGVKLLVEVNGE